MILAQKYGRTQEVLAEVAPGIYSTRQYMQICAAMEKSGCRPMEKHFTNSLHLRHRFFLENHYHSPIKREMGCVYGKAQDFPDFNCFALRGADRRGGRAGLGFLGAVYHQG